MRMQFTLCCCVFVAGLSAADDSNATGHVSDIGNYSVVFPSRPNVLESEKTVATACGNLSIVTSKYETSRVVYSVTFTEYPVAFGEVKPDRLLDGVVAGMTGADGKVLAQKSLSVGDGAGREVTIEARSNWVRAKIHLVGRKLYLVQVSGKKTDTRSDQADLFLESFHLSN